MKIEKGEYKKGEKKERKILKIKKDLRKCRKFCHPGRKRNLWKYENNENKN